MLPQKICRLADSLGIAQAFVMIADAYYAGATMVSWTLALELQAFDKYLEKLAYGDVAVSSGYSFSHYF
jgi:hypothetical protein